METATFARSAVRVSVLVVAVLAIPLTGMAISDEVEWSAGDFVLVGTLLGVIGVCFEVAIRRRGNLLIAGGIATLGVAAAMLGEVGDAPGLILLGCLLIAGSVAIAHRLVQRPA